MREKEIIKILRADIDYQELHIEAREKTINRLCDLVEDQLNEIKELKSKIKLLEKGQAFADEIENFKEDSFEKTVYSGDCKDCKLSRNTPGLFRICVRNGIEKPMLLSNLDKCSKFEAHVRW